MTGQAAWYDLRVKIEKAPTAELHETWPRFEPLASPPGVKAPVALSFGREFNKERR